MTHVEFIQYLEGEDACDAGIQFVKQCSSPQEAWEKCTRSDFMIWYLRRIGYDIKAMLTIACRSIRETKLADGRTVWDLLTDERSRKAVETIERYIKGEASIEELQAAAYAAYAAAYAAYAAARNQQADIIREVIPNIPFTN